MNPREYDSGRVCCEGIEGTVARIAMRKISGEQGEGRKYRCSAMEEGMRGCHDQY
jgi:hypothetical protein